MNTTRTNNNQLRDVKIEVTHKCNLACVHCSSEAHPSNQLEMSKTDCLRIIREGAQLGARKMTFSGGEPFLWKYLPEAVSLAFSFNMEVSIYTTGNTDEYESLVPVLKKCGLERLIFSLFGADKRTHENITRKAGSFEKTLGSIRHARSKNIDTQIHFVPTSKNHTTLEQVITLAESLDVSAVSILRLVPQGRASLLPKDVLSRIQNIDLQSRIKKLREQSRIQIRTGSPYNFLLLNEKTFCEAANDRIIIGPDLYVFPCDAFKGILPLKIVGTDDLSILSQASLSECWSGSPYLNAIRMSIQSELNSQCGSCKNVKLCKSGCLAQKFLKNRSLDSQPDPDCLVKKN